MYDSLNQIGSVNEIETDHLNLYWVRMAPPHFCLYTQKLVDRLDKSRIKKLYALMKDQDRHVYKKTESGSINIDTIKQEIDHDIDEIDDTNGEVNPYHKIVVNKAERDDTIIPQMEQWSILSNVVNYVQYIINIQKTFITEILEL